METVVHTQLGLCFSGLKTAVPSEILGDQRMRFLSSSWAVGDFRLLPLCGQGLGAGKLPKLPLRDLMLVRDDKYNGCWSHGCRDCDR